MKLTKRVFLSKRMKRKSFKELLKEFNINILSEKNKYILLQSINNLMSQDGIPLNMQSPLIKAELCKLIELFADKDLESASKNIYSALTKILDKETLITRARTNLAGNFDARPLHLRPTKSNLQLEDHDMVQLMPKDYGDILIGSALNKNDSTLEEIQKQIGTEFLKEKYNHVFIPIGPGHWRGFYLSKPKDSKNQYQLELFDPYGAHGAQSASFIKLIIGILKSWDIPGDKIKIMFSGPDFNPQTDGHSCGDYTCAYSHKKMKALGVPRNGYNQKMIETLDAHGDNGNRLRETSIEVIATLNTLTPNTEKLDELIEDDTIDPINSEQMNEIDTLFQGIEKTTINEIELLLIELDRQICTINKDNYALNEAKQLLEDLRTAKDDYLTSLKIARGECRHESNPECSKKLVALFHSKERMATDKFMQECSKKILEAIPSLEKNLSWGDYLSNLINRLLNAVIGCFTTNPNSFFHIKKSRSVIQVEQAEVDLRNLVQDKAYESFSS